MVGVSELRLEDESLMVAGSWMRSQFVVGVIVCC